MRIVVGLNKCQGYAQCAFLAPDIFSIQGDEALTYETNSGEEQRTRIRRAAAACPVQAIALEQVDGEAALQSTDPGPDPETQQKKRAEAGNELRSFMEELVEAHRHEPGEDLLSAMIADDGPEGPMPPPPEELVGTGLLLLIAGHETTANLIANGALTLLRHPHELRRLRNDPDLAVPMTEELLRYAPPVHFVPFRTALDDIDIDGTTIPAGASLTLLLAAGNRDPAHVTDPDIFIPDRPNNQHLGFGSGIHICFGAPLARLEAQIALTAFANRLQNPLLVADPPP